MTSRVSPRVLLSSPGNLLAFGFGSGLAPWAPGTFGTLTAIPFYLLLTRIDPYLYLGVIVFGFVAGIKFCANAADELGTHDHPAIVWDEMVGMWIALWLVPFTWFNLLLGFLLFRLFDIVKPWPIRSLDRHVRGGTGIMVDDVVAGILANLVLVLITRSI